MHAIKSTAIGVMYPTQSALCLSHHAACPTRAVMAAFLTGCDISYTGCDIVQSGLVMHRCRGGDIQCQRDAFPLRLLVILELISHTLSSRNNTKQGAFSIRAKNTV